MATESIPDYRGPTRNKFGVPTPSDATGILMPKLQYRFRVTMLGFGGLPDPTIITRNVVSIERPKVNYPEVVLDSYNSKSYIHGKHEWQPVTLVVRDDITNGTTRLVGSQVQRQVNHFQQSTPASGGDYKFDMQLETLDGSNNETDAITGATEVFYLEGCHLQNVDYGANDYSVNDPVTISMTIRFDNCTHYQGDNVLGDLITGGNPFPFDETLNPGATNPIA